MPRRSYAILGGLMFALAMPAVAGTPAQWFKIMDDGCLLYTSDAADEL